MKSSLSSIVRAAVAVLATTVLYGNQVPSASATPYDDAIMSYMPVGYWTFDGDASSANGSTASDASGNSRHGTYTGNQIQLTTNTPGAGSAKALDLSAAPVNVANYIGGISTAGLPNSGAPRTIVGWIKFAGHDPAPGNANAKFQRIFEYGSRGPGNNGYAIDMHREHSSKIAVANHGQWLTSLDSFDNGWHMFAISNGLGMPWALADFYIDGVHVNFPSFTNVIPLGTGLAPGGATIGSADVGADNLQGFRGYLDNIAIFDWEMEAEQIQILYAEMGVGVPEPSTAFLMSLSGLALLALRRRAA